MLKKILIVTGAMMVFAAILTACGPTATVAPVATDVPSAVPPTAPPPTADPAEAIKPIFAASGHADAKALAFTDWDAEKEVPAACARCHTSAGYQEYLATGKVAAGMPVPNKTLECATCHNDTAKKLTSVTFPSGVVVENLGPEAICMTCHQGRESKVSVDAKIEKFGIKDVDAQVAPLIGKDAAGKETKSNFGFSNVHYFAAGGTLYGSQVQMGYQYDGKLYDAKHQHVDGFNTCIGCHDQHSLKVKVEKCSECHADVKTLEDLKNVREPSSARDYDGDGDVKEGVAREIEGLQVILFSAIQNYAREVAGTPIAYDAAAYPYWFVADKDGKPVMTDGKTTSYNKWTARLLKAAYNYQVSIKDPGAFAHGGKYIIELLYDSTADLNAAAKLKTKTDLEKLAREDTGHFDGAAEAFRHWDAASADGKKPAFVVEAACAKCHSASGLPLLIAGKTIPETGVPAGNGLMCLTCHDGANFPARLAVKDVTMPSGKVVSFGDNADSNLCISCHQGRASKKDVDAKIEKFNAVADQDKVVATIKDANGADVKFSFINAHYLGIAAVWFGTDAQGFYEYDGKTYVGANKHVDVDNKPGCVGCHDVHAGAPKEELCKQCHGEVAVDDIRGMSSTVDFNGNGDVKEGIRTEYRSLRDVLYKEIQKYAKAKAGTGITYDPDVYPYWFVDANGDDKADLKDGKTVVYSTWTPRLLKAAFNFNFVRKNPGAAVHNAKYIIQVIFDSIEDLGGDVSKFARP